MKEKIDYCMGECPKCGSEDIDYDVLEIGDTYAFYPAKCEDCGQKFEENYELTYTGTTYEGED
jgi:predicted Zn-ribbon and HTH transcriptional regulator